MKAYRYMYNNKSTLVSSNHNMQPVTVYVNRVDQGRHATGSELILQILVPALSLPFYYRPSSFLVSCVKPYRAASGDTIVRSVDIEKAGDHFCPSYCF